MRDKEPALFARVKGGLYPHNDGARRLLKTLEEWKPVEVLTRKHRNIMRLRAYWAMLNDCIDATGCAPSPEVLHVAIKFGLGYVEGVRLKDGEVRRVVASIAFDKMSETEMIDFFKAAEKWLAEEVGYGG